eukprot:s8825_g3.t1
MNGVDPRREEAPRVDPPRADPRDAGLAQEGHIVRESLDASVPAGLVEATVSRPSLDAEMRPGEGSDFMSLTESPPSPRRSRFAAGSHGDQPHQAERTVEMAAYSYEAAEGAPGIRWVIGLAWYSSHYLEVIGLAWYSSHYLEVIGLAWYSSHYLEVIGLAWYSSHYLEVIGLAWYSSHYLEVIGLAWYNSHYLEVIGRAWRTSSILLKEPRRIIIDHHLGVAGVTMLEGQDRVGSSKTTFRREIANGMDHSMAVPEHQMDHSMAVPEYQMDHSMAVPEYQMEHSMAVPEYQMEHSMAVPEYQMEHSMAVPEYQMEHSMAVLE